MKAAEVKDGYHFTYGVFYLMAVLTFVPFQFFPVATEYWMFKFRDPSRDGLHPGRPPIPPKVPQSHFPKEVTQRDSNRTIPKNRTPFQVNFASSFTIVCVSTLLGSLIFTVIFSNKLPPPEERMMGAFISIFIMFVVNIAFTQINTDGMQAEFFGITIFVGALLNIASAVAITSLYEIVRKFPIGYYYGLVSGQSICGILSALMQIITLSLCLPITISGATYFSAGGFVVLCTTIFYSHIKRNSKYFIYRIGQSQKDMSHLRNTWGSVKIALKKIKWYYIAVVFVHGSSTIVHPGLTSLIVPTKLEYGSGSIWNEVYFVPVATFLNFGVFNLIGRELARKVPVQKSGIHIMVAAIMRVAFVPVLMFCNVQPRFHLPVYFGDTFYIICLTVFAFTEGLLYSMVIIGVTTVAREGEFEAAMVLIPIITVITINVCSWFNMLIICLI